MRKIVPVLLILFFLAGCRSSFKSNFRDFSAYYNTFYNAKKSYNLGVEKSLNQPRNYNTLQPIRVYETPLGAGGSDFQNAIDKGASILRKFDDTKWVDDALEIIGKSYYYRMEYFSADQKFDEQYITSTSDAMKQRAVFWKGRVLYEFQAHSQAIQYLTEQLAVFDGNWSGDLEFQVKTILAEHYIAEENWVIALDLLNEGIPGIPGRANKERGYFLIGQINEILGDPKAAFDAYDNVEKHYNVYELQFEAKKKKAEVARALGNSDEAFRVFSSMVRDDKNTEFVAELNFELGKTEQDRSNFDKAERIYQSILRDPFYKPSNITKAQVYNGLAEIYRFNNKDFTLAAAYYDSSARMNVSPDQLPDSYNAKELADSFGQYASIKNQIHEKDSLLWLGMLSPDEFDSVLTEIENRMVQEMERLRKEQEEQRNTLVNVNQSQNANNQIGTGTNGFLNVENPVLIAQAREQFNAIWQGRPLVDNWRVNELILNTIQSDSTFAQEESVNGANPAAQTLVNIDLSRIPFTASEQDSMRHEKSFLYYEIGNLFFLSLNLPDSAEFYFNKLLEEQPYSEVAPVTMYSLTELYTIQGQNVLAQARAQELVETFPNSIYADRLMDKFELERPDVEMEEGTDPITTFLALSSDNSLGYLERAQALSQFSISEPQNSVSDRALYESIQNYIRVAKSQPNFEDTLYTWQQMKKNWEDSLEHFQDEQELAKTVLADTTVTLAASDSLYYVSLIDSTLSEPDFAPYFPYYGEYWDSTRTTIEAFNTLFSLSGYSANVKTLEREFKLPEIAIPEAEMRDSTMAEPDNPVMDSDYLDCGEIREYPQIRGGIESFNARLELPGSIQEDVIEFLFFINSRGIIDEFKLNSDIENEDLVNAYVDAIDAHISFEPILVDGESRAIVCGIEFEIPTN